VPWQDVIHVRCGPDPVGSLAVFTPGHVVKLPLAQPSPGSRIKEPISLRAGCCWPLRVLLAKPPSRHHAASWMIADYVLGLSVLFVGCHCGLPSFLFTSLWRSIAHWAKLSKSGGLSLVIASQLRWQSQPYLGTVSTQAAYHSGVGSTTECNAAQAARPWSSLVTAMNSRLHSGQVTSMDLATLAAQPHWQSVTEVLSGVLEWWHLGHTCGRLRRSCDHPHWSQWYNIGPELEYYVIVAATNIGQKVDYPTRNQYIMARQHSHVTRQVVRYAYK
jgi:hypothetical protein